MIRSVTRAVFALILCSLCAVSWGQQALQQSATSRKVVFLLVQSSDHITGLTGATPTVTISKNGAAFGAPAGTVAELSSGWYVLTPTSADTGTLGPLLLHATAASADPTDKEFNVVAYNPDDATRLGLGALPNSAANGVGGLPVLDANSLVDVDLKRWLTVAPNALATGRVDASVGAYPGNTPQTGDSYPRVNLALPNVAAGALNGLPLGDASGRVALQPMDSMVTQSGTVAAAASSTLTLNGSASSVDGTYVGSLVKVYAGTGVGQVRLIIGYVGSTKVATVGSAWTTTPIAGDSYAVLYMRTPLIDQNGYVTLTAGEHVEIAADTKDGLNGAQPGSPAVGSLYAIANKFQFDGSNNVKSAPQTTVTLAAGQNVATVGGLAPPTNWNLLSIDGAGKVAFNNTSIGSVTGAVGSVTGNVTVGGYAAGQSPDTLVLGATASSWNTALTIGNKINAAASAGDPWSTTLPGAYGAGTAGFKVGTYLDAAMTTRMAAFTLPLNFSTLAIDGSGRTLLQPTQTGVTIPIVTTLSNAPLDSSGITTILSRLPTALTFSGSSVNAQVASYASGQDPPALLQAMTVDGTLTWKQKQAIDLALHFDAARTFNATTHTAVLTWYRRASGGTGVDLTKPIVVKTTIYDSSNTQVVSQSTTFSNLP